MGTYTWKSNLAFAAVCLPVLLIWLTKRWNKSADKHIEALNKWSQSFEED